MPILGSMGDSNFAVLYFDNSVIPRTYVTRLLPGHLVLHNS